MLHLNINLQNLECLLSLLTKAAGAKLLTIVVLNAKTNDRQLLFSDESDLDEETLPDEILNSISSLNMIESVDSMEAHNFSAREREIISYLLRGLSQKMIAHELSISINTVRNHISSIYRKMDVHSAQQVLARLTGHDVLP